MTSVQIIRCTSPDELVDTVDAGREWCGACIELDLREGTLLAGTVPAFETGVPLAVWHGYRRRWGIPIVTGEAANQLLEDLAPLAQRILDDWDEEMGPHGLRAVLGEDAEEADEEIEALTVDEEFDSRDLVELHDTESATTGDEVDELGITADTTDDELDEMVQRTVAELSSSSDSGVAAVVGLHHYLRQVRDELRED